MSDHLSLHGEPAPLTVCVVGLGYIGLPTAAVLARQGHRVIGIDVRPEVVETINRGKIHIHEPGLGELVERVVQSGHLRAAMRPELADVFIICVPTPIAEDKSPDLAYVEAASKSIRDSVRPGNLIILESTSPPKTTEGCVASLAVPRDLQIGRDVFVAYCPERVLPGRILVELVENDRIVGGLTPACTLRGRQFYETFVTGSVLTTTAVGAELTKLAENAFRDVNIAIANELSMLCADLDADAFEVIAMANRHPRVNILTPGPGVGGHCISVDPWFLVHAAPGASTLFRTARLVNDSKPDFVVQQVISSAVPSSTIGCLGLTYKADVDDLRESPSLHIANSLARRFEGHVLACDPYVRQAECPEIDLVDLDELLRRSDVVVLLTDHQRFRDLSRADLEGKRVIDTRGVWRPPANFAQTQVAVRNDRAPSSLRAA